MVSRILPPACLVVAALTLGSIAPAWAQGGRQWMSTDQSPPGTPAEVRFDPSASGPTDSFFDVFIHGFWIDPFVGPDQQTYFMIDVPDQPDDMHPGVFFHRSKPIGAPELPAIRFNLAVPTNASDVRMGQSTFFDVFFNNILIAPEFIPGMDSDEDDAALGGTLPPPREPAFTRDETIYHMTMPWPPTNGDPSVPVQTMLGSIPGVGMQVYPFQWNPGDRQLRVWRQARLHFIHGGTPQTSPPITRERSRLAAKKFANWPGVLTGFPFNPVFYTADFLFVYPTGYAEEIKPLVDQKKARGFLVTEHVIAPTGNTCASIEAIIDAWYGAAPAWRDKYCILVGDVNVIPTCNSPALGTDYPAGVPTDDRYASVPGIDLNEEIYLGRFSVDSEADLTNQVAKTLAYEDAPPLFGNFSEALLVAHKEDAPGKYVGAHESVRTAVYTTPPVFTTLYGHIAGVDDADVTAEINAGLGLVAYRGHGSSGAWTGWNTLNEFYDTGDVGGLANGAMTPVLWGFACTNQSLSTSDCLGETWMEQVGGGAVSHYGATVPSYTVQNHELDRRMFRGLYFWGLTTQSQDIDYAEAMMEFIEGPENAWMYLLLGDPDMQIRRRSPVTLTVLVPNQIPICPIIPPCDPLRIRVLGPQGQPMPEVLVSLWKPAGPPGQGETMLGGGDEVFDNRYTAADGFASVPASPTTPGLLFYSVQDDNGNTATGTIEVTTAVGVTPGAAGAFQFRAVPSVLRSSTMLSFGTVLGRSATVQIHDVGGRRIRTLEAAAGVGGIRWDGTDQSGEPVSSGLYFARFVSGELSFATRVVVAR